MMPSWVSAAPYAARYKLPSDQPMTSRNAVVVSVSTPHCMRFAKRRGRLVLSAALALSCVIDAMAADTIAPPPPILPAGLHWFTPPNNAALQGAWVLGAEAHNGPYLLRVKLAAGGRIAPHTHPDTRNSTVLAGTLYVGFGNRFDETKVIAVPTGGVYVAPANVAHYVWAKDGAVVYQEAGVGPTRTVPVKR